MKPILKSALIATSLAFATSLTMSAPSFAVDEVLISAGAAVQGYDVIAYHDGSGPTKGSGQYSTTFEGATYKFASQANLDQFKSNPSQYVPAYGGFCAFGVTKGKKFETDPAAYTVVDGTLYLNKNRRVNKAWNKNQTSHISTAEQKWPEIQSVAVEDL